MSAFNLVKSMELSQKELITLIREKPADKLTQIVAKFYREVDEDEDWCSCGFPDDAFYTPLDFEESSLLAETNTQPYTDDKIAGLLNYYLACHSNAAYFSVLYQHDWCDNNAHTLYGEVDDYHKRCEQHKREEKNCQDKIIIPIHVARNHWSFIYVLYSRHADTLPSIYYVAPKGDKLPGDLKTLILSNGAFAGCQIKTIRRCIPHPHRDAGVWLIEAARTIAAKGVMPSRRHNLHEARMEHNKAILHCALCNEGNPPYYPRCNHCCYVIDETYRSVNALRRKNEVSLQETALLIHQMLEHLGVANYLDIPYQCETMLLLKTLNQTPIYRKQILMALHQWLLTGLEVQQKKAIALLAELDDSFRLLPHYPLEQLLPMLQEHPKSPFMSSKQQLSDLLSAEAPLPLAQAKKMTWAEVALTLKNSVVQFIQHLHNVALKPSNVSKRFIS